MNYKLESLTNRFYWQTLRVLAVVEFARCNFKFPIHLSVVYVGFRRKLFFFSSFKVLLSDLTAIQRLTFPTRVTCQNKMASKTVKSPIALPMIIFTDLWHVVNYIFQSISVSRVYKLLWHFISFFSGFPDYFGHWKSSLTLPCELKAKLIRDRDKFMWRLVAYCYTIEMENYLEQYHIYFKNVSLRIKLLRLLFFVFVLLLILLYIVYLLSAECTIEPSRGQSLDTIFNITCSGWTSPPQLIYEFRYTLGNGLQGRLYQGNTSSFRTVLIRNISSIQTLVRDGNRTVGETALNVSVRVI